MLAAEAGIEYARDNNVCQRVDCLGSNCVLACVFITGAENFDASFVGGVIMRCIYAVVTAYRGTLFRVRS